MVSSTFKSKKSPVKTPSRGQNQNRVNIRELSKNGTQKTQVAFSLLLLPACLPVCEKCTKWYSQSPHVVLMKPLLAPSRLEVRMWYRPYPNINIYADKSLRFSSYRMPLTRLSWLAGSFMVCIAIHKWYFRIFYSLTMRNSIK